MKRKSGARKGGGTSGRGKQTASSSRSIKRSRVLRNSWLEALLHATTDQVGRIHFKSFAAVQRCLEPAGFADIDCPDPDPGCQLKEIITNANCWCLYRCADGSAYIEPCKVR